MCRKGYISTRPSLPGENKDCGQILRGMGYDASLLKPANEGGDPDLAAVLISSAQEEIYRKSEQMNVKKDCYQEFYEEEKGEVLSLPPVNKPSSLLTESPEEPQNLQQLPL